MSAKKDRDGPVTIKKYANRRLYNTSTSSYVTLDHLCQMVKDGIDFVVYDAKTGEDLTRSVLTQIIVEEEAKGENLLPIGFLRQIIGFYGDSMKGMMLPQYLEHSMKTFAENQEQLQSYFQDTMEKIFPFGALDEIGKQNLAMFQQTLKMFSTPEQAKYKKSVPEEYKNQEKNTETEEVYELRKRLDEMQRQIDKIIE